MSDSQLVTPTRPVHTRRPVKLQVVTPRVLESTACLATLMADTTGQFYIDGYRHFILKVATSCLAQPEAGDRVRFIEDEDKVIIIDVLYCADAERCLTLTSRHSQLKISAAMLNIEGRETLALSSDHLSLVSRTCRWMADSLKQIARTFQLSCIHADRHVEQTDTLLARHIVQDAKQSYRLESKLAAINAKAVLKIDGSQIHMG